MKFSSIIYAIPFVAVILITLIMGNVMYDKTKYDMTCINQKLDIPSSWNKEEFIINGSTYVKYIENTLVNDTVISKDKYMLKGDLYGR
jgi:hypothetical protein